MPQEFCRGDDCPNSISCMISVGERVREERGRCGVVSYIAMLCELLPRCEVEPVAKRLCVPLPPAVCPPPPPPQPPHCPQTPPRKKNDMDEFMKMMKLLNAFGGG